jgi:hypothetical protein
LVALPDAATQPAATTSLLVSVLVLITQPASITSLLVATQDVQLYLAAKTPSLVQL